MKARFFAAAVLAFLYASPVLGAALASPYPRAQDEEVTVDSPDGEVTDVTVSSPGETSKDENPEQPPQEGSPEQPPQEGNTEQPPQEGNPEQPPPAEQPENPPPPPGEDKKEDQPSSDSQSGSGGLPISLPGVTENLGTDGESAIKQAQEPGADAEDTSKAVAEGANAQNNLQQLANTVAEAEDAIAKNTDIFEMTVTFQGPRGKLEANIGKLPETNGRLENLNVCQASTMAWVDNEARESISLSMGKTERLGSDALAYRDAACESRIDQGDPWPPESQNFVEGDRVPFYYKLMGLTEGQIFGLEPLADGTYLPKLTGESPDAAAAA
ncbi:hypothetical protein TWF281_001586 [Arthrobotrys megalospora]